MSAEIVGFYRGVRRPGTSELDASVLQST